MSQRELLDRAQRAALVSSPFAVVAADAEGRVVLWNPEAERLFGWPAEEVLGRPLLELGVVPAGEEAAQFEAQRRLALSGARNSRSLDATRLRRDGTAFTARIWPSPLRDAEGELTGFLGFVADVTEEQRREAERRVDEERFRAIFARSHDAILIFEPDRDQVLDANPSACDMLGFSRQDLLRQRPSTIHAHEPVAFQRFVARVREEGVARTDQLSCADNRGALVPCEISASWVRSEQDSWVLAIIRDGRARRRMETRLRAAEQRYRDLYEQAPFAYFSVDVDGRIRLANRAANAMLAREDLVGSRVLDLYDPDRPEGRARAEQVLERFRAGRRIHGEELAMRAADGRTVWTSLSVSPVRGEDGEVVASRSIVEDVTARKRAEAELAASVADLERLNAELRQLAFGVAHDLAGPLRTVTAYTRLLEQHYRDHLDPQAVQLFGYLDDGATRLRHLSGGLLGYAQAGQEQYERAEVDMDALVDRTLRALAAQLTDTGAQVTVAELPTVWGEEAGLGTVVQNLLANALRFPVAGEPPVIRVEARREAGGWRFEFTDQGVGIDPASHERIFEMFRRARDQQHRHGAGIGLAICRKIIERHGGRIWVRSARGAGSTFCFTVPDHHPPR
ncbi:MAG: PAS domain S-box protein [Nitriliruptoraceae bacterium]